MIWRLVPEERELNENRLSSQNLDIFIPDNQNILDIKLVQGWESRFYGHKKELPCLEITFQGNEPIKTLISW